LVVGRWRNKIFLAEKLRMSKQTVYLIVDLNINAGKLDAFKGLAQTMTDVSQKESGTLGYEWYFSADSKRCRLVETYVDAGAVLAHFMGPAVQELVPKLVEVASVSSFEIYGDPGPKVTEMVAGFGAEIFSFWQGLER
jgi:quinol monooxygenase YgiN